MPATGLLTLIDDIASLLDDIALLTRVAAKKTAGVIGDDLALNAQQVTGMTADRELPVIWAVAKGALLNKAIIVPVALAISAWLPWAITPLLMIGGIFLCFEGFEKVWEEAACREPAHAAERVARVQAVADPAVDVVAFEKERVRGAVRTDFILSAEIVVIALGTMSAEPIVRQIVALTVIGVGVTVLVYGLVAGIVKLDDLGMRLQRGAAPSSARQVVGSAILRGTPWLMKTLSIVGTAAMFLVGGSIIVHGVPPLEHLLHDLLDPLQARGAFLGGVASTLADAVVGIVAGGITAGVVHLVKHGRAPHPSAAH
jgi:predicted DNA repair protein MutK